MAGAGGGSRGRGARTGDRGWPERERGALRAPGCGKSHCGPDLCGNRREAHVCNRETTEIWMQFDRGVPAEVYPGALRYAVPYAKPGRAFTYCSTALHDNSAAATRGAAARACDGARTGTRAGRINGHSASGLMKAHRAAGDFDQMSFRTLAFTAEDVDLIQIGVARSAERSKARRDSRGSAEHSLDLRRARSSVSEAVGGPWRGTIDTGEVRRDRQRRRPIRTARCRRVRPCPTHPAPPATGAFGGAFDSAKLGGARM